MQGTRRATGPTPLREGGGAAMSGRGCMAKDKRQGPRRGEYCGRPSRQSRLPPAPTKESISLRMDHAKACIHGHPQYSPRRPFLPLRTRNPQTIFLRAAPPLGGGRMLAHSPFSKSLSTISRQSSPSTMIPEGLEQIKKKCSRKPGRARLRPGLVFRPCTRPRQSAALPKRLQHFLNRSKTSAKRRGGRFWTREAPPCKTSVSPSSARSVFCAAGRRERRPTGRARPPGGPRERMAHCGPPGGRPLPAARTMPNTRFPPPSPTPER